MIQQISSTSKTDEFGNVDGADEKDGEKLAKCINQTTLGLEDSVAWLVYFPLTSLAVGMAVQ